MMINCEKASELTSKKIDKKLRFIEKLSLKFHTLMCSTCALFEDEALVITASIKKENTQNKHNHKMCKESKEKLQKLLIEKNKNLVRSFIKDRLKYIENIKN